MGDNDSERNENEMLGSRKIIFSRCNFRAEL
jgi:hypothetical protein